MSAGVFRAGQMARTARRMETVSSDTVARSTGVWSPERFAEGQIRSLVRQVFSSSAGARMRQVVFSALEPETDVRGICRSVGETLALETAAEVAVVTNQSHLLDEGKISVDSWECAEKNRITPMRELSKRVRGNLWLVPLGENGSQGTSTASLHRYLGEIRREFEYSIVAGPASGESSEAVAMAHFADGIILVLSAERTRRLTAIRIRDELEASQARFLGVVLSGREFPIPEMIYRRL